MARIALIGAGRMGRPFGRRLLAAGHALTVVDRDPAAVCALVAEGARGARDLAEALTDEALADRPDVAITSLPTPAVVEEVVLGDGGVLARLERGAALLEMSTGPPALARAIADAARERGIEALDAPVSGGPLGAGAGTLSIMVGGAPEAFDRVLPVLEALGSTIRHMGPPGAGQATKLANNLLAAVTMTALGEAVALARAEGLDMRAMYEAIAGASGDSSVLRQRFPVPGVLERAPASHDWEALFPVDLLIKDIRLALGAAAEHGLRLPAAELALHRYGEAQAAGWGGLDYSTVARLVQAAEQL